MRRAAISAAALFVGTGLASCGERGAPRAPGRAATPGRELVAVSSREVEVLSEVAAAPFDKWSLWSDGAKLRGANVWQKVIDPARDGDALGTGKVGPPYADGELAELARLGANYVNVSHAGVFSEEAPYVVLPDVVASLDRLLDAIEAADMFAVLAFRTGPGRNEAAFGNAGARGPAPLHDVFRDEAAQAAWASMWRYTAERYRGRSVVAAYDLMVEPNAGEALFGGPTAAQFYAAHRGSRADWNVLAARVVASVREVDPQTPCIVEAMGFASPSWLPYLVAPPDARTLLGVHLYEPHAYTHPRPGVDVGYPQLLDPDGDGHPELVARPWLGALVERIARAATKLPRPAPVTVNELGVTRWARGGAWYVRDLVDALDAAGMNHAIWLWESRWPKIDYDPFNVRHGTARDHRADAPLAENALLRVLAGAWAKNVIRPSSTTRPR